MDSGGWLRLSVYVVCVAGGPGSASLIFGVPLARFLSVGLLLSHHPVTHHSLLFLPTCPEDSFGTGFRPVLFSAPRPVSFSSPLLLPSLDEHSLHPDFLPKLLAAFRLQSSSPVRAFWFAGVSLSTLNC